VNNNQLTDVNLFTLVVPKMALLPNPVSTINLQQGFKNPISTLSQVNLTYFLTQPVLAKRQSSSTIGGFTVDQLLAMCPLNYVYNQNILIGCLSGIVYFCSGQTDLTNCQNYYNTIFSYSIYASIGANCPAWKYGVSSTQCQTVVNNFRASFEYGDADKVFASFFVSTLFANPTFAPCDSSKQTCRW